jgi:predicted nucleic acid-binding protein
MLIYLDTNIVIYFVEKHSKYGSKVGSRLAAAQVAKDAFALSDLTRMECLVGPLKSGKNSLLTDFNSFFQLPTVTVLTMLAAVFDRAAHIRATWSFSALDALHLAAAVEHGCGLFLTNDARLARFPDIPVEILT